MKSDIANVKKKVTRGVRGPGPKELTIPRRLWSFKASGVVVGQKGPTTTLAFCSRWSQKGTGLLAGRIQSIK